MKYPEYDSPFELVINNIAAQAAKQIDEECWQVIQRVGINVDKEKLLIALKQDSERYREAFRRGKETGYTKRDEEIIRCKDCANGEVRTQPWDGVQYVECHAHEEEGYDHEDGHPLDWFCADGERNDDLSEVRI